MCIAWLPQVSARSPKIRLLPNSAPDHGNPDIKRPNLRSMLITKLGIRCCNLQKEVRVLCFSKVQRLRFLAGGVPSPLVSWDKPLSRALYPGASQPLNSGTPDLQSMAFDDHIERIESVKVTPTRSATTWFCRVRHYGGK